MHGLVAERFPGDGPEATARVPALPWKVNSPREPSGKVAYMDSPELGKGSPGTSWEKFLWHRLVSCSLRISCYHVSPAKGLAQLNWEFLGLDLALGWNLAEVGQKQ